MKNILLYGYLLLFLTISTFGYSSIRQTSLVRQEYKRALDAGADAAAKHHTYVNDENLYGLSAGFGEGYEDTKNVKLDKEDCSKWFYKIFFSNIGVDDRPILQEKLKEYITMKCLIQFDRISISNEKDIWSDREYIITYNGSQYLFTLSQQLKNLNTGDWVTADEIGLTESERSRLISDFIAENIERFINDDSNIRNNQYYSLHFDNTDFINDIDGVAVIVFVEGMPIPSRNVFNPNQKYYGFSFGGSEILRENSI